MAYPLMQAGALEQGSTLQFVGSYPEFLSIYYSRFHIGTGPLWFVETLLIFAGFYVLWRLFAENPARPVQDDSKVPSNLIITLFAFILSVVTFIVRIWLPIGWSFKPLNFRFPCFPQ